ncbi:MAG TPA: response regulator transcription factor [Chloroflexota bacterium]|nr:response regulator transcription factor [Chloroflexota bacterium]
MVAEIRCIIVVDPVPDKIMPLVDNLARYGYAADVCRPESWMSHVAGSSAAAMVVGPNMVSLQLWTFCQEVREQSVIPLVVLGNAPSPDQVALALEGGADACLQADPPLSARQVVAAIRAIERRSRLSGHARNEVIEAGALRIDLARKEVASSGRHVALTPTEFGILAVLAQQPGRVLSSVEILRQVHGYEAEPAEAQDIVKVHVSRLRQKLEEDPQSPRRIVNVRGQGYIYMFERRADQAAL